MEKAAYNFGGSSVWMRSTKYRHDRCDPFKESTVVFACKVHGCKVFCQFLVGPNQYQPSQVITLVITSPIQTGGQNSPVCCNHVCCNSTSHGLVACYCSYSQLPTAQAGWCNVELQQMGHLLQLSGEDFDPLSGLPVQFKVSWFKLIFVLVFFIVE